jgi:hypothetical protein
MTDIPLPTFPEGEEFNFLREFPTSGNRRVVLHVSIRSYNNYGKGTFFVTVSLYPAYSTEQGPSLVEPLITRTLQDVVAALSIYRIPTCMTNNSAMFEGEFTPFLLRDKT